MNIPDTLLNTALHLFSRYGMKAMTMDDIARACGISKKTLYKQYENKTQLVDALITAAVDRIKNDYADNTANSVNAIEETINLLRHFEVICKHINFRMLMDLQKYYYQSWLRVDAFKQKMWQEIIEENLKRGRAEGLYSDEFDKGIIAGMRLQQLAFMHQTALYNLSLHETLMQVTIHYLKGIATSKGLTLIKKITHQTNTI
jgi:AcrR family transcriptional regulator